MEIINLIPHQLKKASVVLAASFFDYPMFTFYFPDLKRRSRYLPWYFQNILNCALRYGKVYTTHNISGVAFTLPPFHTKISLWEYIRNGFLSTPFVMGFRKFKQSMDCERFVEDTQAKLMQYRPHYYLWGLAVEPRQKAKGIGSALMQRVLEKADAENKPVYLETHAERNVPYYQKHGFDLINTTRIPQYNLPIWCMFRESY